MQGATRHPEADTSRERWGRVAALVVVLGAAVAGWWWLAGAGLAVVVALLVVAQRRENEIVRAATAALVEAAPAMTPEQRHAALAAFDRRFPGRVGPPARARAAVRAMGVRAPAQPDAVGRPNAPRQMLAALGLGWPLAVGGGLAIALSVAGEHGAHLAPYAVPAALMAAAPAALSLRGYAERGVCTVTAALVAGGALVGLVSAGI